MAKSKTEIQPVRVYMVPTSKGVRWRMSRDDSQARIDADPEPPKIAEPYIVETFTGSVQHIMALVGSGEIRLMRDGEPVEFTFQDDVCVAQGNLMIYRPDLMAEGIRSTRGLSLAGPIDVGIEFYGRWNGAT